MERRNFLLAAGTLAGAPAVACAASLAALPPTPTTLRLAGFRSLVGQQFIAFQGKRGTSLDLLAVRPGKAVPHQEQFTLLFTGEPGLVSGIYEIDNPLAGRLSIFMEPAGRGPATGPGALYRAEYSLLV
ncbi:hypothetical protein SAMN05518865_11918 [Duganella sp. CF458]|uniref:DUF6916 family protein n=1 Tax=Duganella sp. CF458 TaxID=1884368 RepID=UPI0008EC24D8|nr:hypothetical protein [Duganella sp. CF458]SFG80693.1 hypothetical protein SAMN05518865_11918 [Duganella sp. CF458]